MKIDYSNEKPKFNRKRKGEMPNLIHEFMEKDERVMTLTYDTECSARYSIFNTQFYIFSKWLYFNITERTRALLRKNRSYRLNAVMETDKRHW